MNENSQIINWNDELENLMANIGEKCQAYSLLHMKAEEKYTNYNNRISIPVIILSTLTGATSVGSTAMFGESLIAPIAIGLVSIFTGILSTVNNYFRYAQRQEAHRMVSINYKKLSRFINIELSLPRNQRMPVKPFLKFIRNETDRLIEVSPQIPSEAIEYFNEKYKSSGTAHPEECNGLDNIVPNRKEPEKDKTFLDIMRKIDSKMSFNSDKPLTSIDSKENIIINVE